MNYDKYFKNTYIPNKEEIKYTQDNYLSKRVLTQKLGGQIIASTWLKISKFRDKYFLYLPLKNNFAKNNPDTKIKIMLPGCINKTIKDIEDLKLECLLELKDISEENLKLLQYDALINEIEILLKTNNINITNDLIKQLIKKNDINECISPDERFAYGMYKILLELSNKKLPKYDLELINNWALLLLNKGQILKNDINSTKTNNYINKNNNDFIEIEEFIQNANNYAMPIRISATFSYCRLGNLFIEKYNDLFSLLSMYYVLSENNTEIFKYLKFTNNLISKNLQFLINAFTDTSNENGDLTYILNVLIDNYYLSLNELLETLKNISKNNVTKYKLNIINNVKNENEIKDTVYYMSKYPLISRKQAIFFTTHCKPDRYYSVKDFQKSCKACQETARYSMKNLVKIGLYLEIKVGKKFLYKINNIEINK